MAALTGGSLSPRAMIVLLVAAILISTVLAIVFTDITGTSTDDDDGPTSELMARTGCFDMELRPAEGDPPVSLFDAEADVRAQIERPEAVAEVTTDNDDGFVPGDLIWAEYGELVPAEGEQFGRGEAWVLVFEDERHETWWDRLANRRIDARFSVVYRGEPGQIVAACSGQV